jgi:hypothetical protein
MSVFFPVLGAVEEPVSLRPANTSVNDLLTLAATEEVAIIGFIMANEDAGAHVVSIWYTIASTDYLIFRDTIAANETVREILPAPIRLAGKIGTRKIRVQADAADEVTFTVIFARSNAAASVS